MELKKIKNKNVKASKQISRNAMLWENQIAT